MISDKWILELRIVQPCLLPYSRLTNWTPDLYTQLPENVLSGLISLRSRKVELTKQTLVLEHFHLEQIENRKSVTRK